MVEYEKEILKSLRKKKIPERIFLQFHHCFQSIDNNGDMTIFDVKKIKGDYEKEYYRIRKGQYRAIFYLEHKSIYVISLEHRSEVYRRWE